MGTVQVPAHAMGSLYPQLFLPPVPWVPYELHKLGQPPISIVEAKTKTNHQLLTRDKNLVAASMGGQALLLGKRDATSDYNRWFSIPDMSGFS